MHIVIPILLLGVGIAMIVKGGDLFVTSSVAMAARAGIPRVVIGGTLVSLATTAPELAVSVTASLRGHSGLAVGNAVGSTICNIGLIVGVLCILRPMEVRREDFAMPVRFMLGAGVLLTVLAWPLQLSRSRGLALLACAPAYLAIDYLRRRRQTVPAAAGAPAAAQPAPSMSMGRALAGFGVGTVLVIVASRLLADNGVRLAAMLGMPPMIVGLTLVAVGTSLPELVTAITAARKGVPDLSLGNVVGANILNITLVTGAAGAIHPLTMTRRTQIFSFPAMLGFFVLLMILARTGRKLTRQEGWILMTCYVVYVGGLFVVESLRIGA